MPTKTALKKTPIKSLKVIESKKDENCIIGIVGNKLWILAKQQPEKSDDILSINESKTTLLIEWHANKNDLIKELLSDFNLLKNGTFGNSNGKSISGWEVDVTEPANANVDLSEEWYLKDGHTAFLFAPTDAERPGFISKHKIPTIEDGSVDYFFSGYFATHRAGGIITIDFYDGMENKLGESIITIPFDPKYGGGRDLTSYAHIESVFTPAKKTQYMRFKIKLGEQKDFTEPHALLFFTELYLGLHSEARENRSVPYSDSIDTLITSLLNEKWTAFGHAQLQILEEQKTLSVSYCDNTYKIALKKELAIIKLIEEQGIQAECKNINILLKKEKLDHLILADHLNLKILQGLNKDYYFDSLYSFIQMLIGSPPKTIRIFSDAQKNSQFYVQLGMMHEKQHRNDLAHSLYCVSLYFYPNTQAHEHLGNLALSQLNYVLASTHYKQAIALQSKSYWVYSNLSQALKNLGLPEKAIEVLVDGIKIFPEKKYLLDKLAEMQRAYWQLKSECLNSIAIANNRSELLIETEKAVKTIAESYKHSFLRISNAPLTTKSRDKKILVVADTFLPQCLRYRVKQKVEQLSLAGFEANYISWTEAVKAFQAITWHDRIIFYRVPALPDVIQLIEYAKSLGKPTLYEIDDLIFEPIYPPDIQSYGGQVELGQYYDLLKGMALYQCAAQLCDYALASTQPLLDKLIPLVKTKQGFLHRNALDSNNILNLKTVKNEELITLFYGSGTLAHNSDFIDDVLPAIDRIFKEFTQVRLVIAGHLQLPSKFSMRYKKQIITLPFTKNYQVYNTYLRGADINIAVLKQDEINDCKSELKWFEAACFGIPSVVSKTRNYQDVIRQGKDGFIVNSTDQWHKILKRLITQFELREKVGYAAFQRVKKDYSLLTMSKNLSAIFASLNGSLLTNNQEKKHEKTKIGSC